MRISPVFAILDRVQLISGLSALKMSGKLMSPWIVTVQVPEPAVPATRLLDG